MNVNFYNQIRIGNFYMESENEDKQPEPYLGPRKSYLNYIFKNNHYFELFRITPLPIIITGIVPPMCAAVLSIFIALTFHNSSISNYKWTCGRARFPSLSRIINLPVERTLWQLLILAHLPIRVIEVSTIFVRFYRLYNVYHKYPLIYELSRYLYLILGLGELFFLGGLSLVGERENTKLHVILFYIFGVMGLGFFMVNCYCHRHSLYYVKPYGVLSFKLKILFMTCYIGIAPVVITSFFLYWKKCLLWAYDVFALSEYLGVFCNIAFHACAILDVKDKLFLGIRLVVPLSTDDPIEANAISFIHSENSLKMKKNVTFSKDLFQCKDFTFQKSNDLVKNTRSSIQMDL